MTGAERYFQKLLEDPTYREEYEMSMARLNAFDRHARMFRDDDMVHVGSVEWVEEGAAGVTAVWVWPCQECGAAVMDRDMHFEWHMLLSRTTASGI